MPVRGGEKVIEDNVFQCGVSGIDNFYWDLCDQSCNQRAKKSSLLKKTPFLLFLLQNITV